LPPGPRRRRLTSRAGPRRRRLKRRSENAPLAEARGSALPGFGQETARGGG
jgi:hypothetical protein